LNLDIAHLSLGPLTLNFYGLMYAVAFVVAYYVTHWYAKKLGSDLSKENIADIIFYTAIGGVIGGRLGYVFIYSPELYLSNPAQIFAVWKGGMSIHGGLIGGALGVFLIIKKLKLPFRETVDLFMPALALGLFFGRIGNFVNGELPGRVTDAPWGMDFGDGENRHPSTLYAAGKDLLLFGVLFSMGLTKKLRPGTLISLFFIIYGLFRFFVEFFREPDPQVGLLLFDLSMGQWLSVGVILFGVGFYLWGKKKELRS